MFGFEGDVAGKGSTGVRLAGRSIMNLFKGLTLWSIHNVVMLVVVAATLVAPIVVIAAIETLSKAFADYLIWWMIPLVYTVPAAGLVYGYRRLRAVREDIPEIGASFHALRTLRDGTWDEDVQGGELSVVEDALMDGGLSVSTAAGGGDLEVTTEASSERARDHVRTPHDHDRFVGLAVDPADEPARGFFAILWRMWRVMWMICASFILPSWWMAAALDLPVGSAAAFGPGILFLIMSLVGAAFYHGHRDMSAEELESRHSVTRAYAVLVLVGITTAAFLTHGVLGAVGVVGVPVAIMMLSWFAFRAYRGGQVEASEVPHVEDPTRRGVTFEFDEVVVDDEVAVQSVSDQ